MKFDELKDQVVEIAKIAGSVPERFQERCFEILLNALVAGAGKAPPTTADAEPASSGKPDASPGDGATDQVPTPSQMRVFMQRTSVTADELAKVVAFLDSEVHFIREPSPTKVTTGQMEWALLLSLKNGIETNSLAADPEAIRSICQEKGYYDAANFAAIFKRPAYAKWFKKPLESQGEPQPLTADGQQALGKLIKRLATE
jgi:hypothetical protein